MSVHQPPSGSAHTKPTRDVIREPVHDEFVTGRLVRTQWCPVDRNCIEVIISYPPGHQLRWCFAAEADTPSTEAVSDYAIRQLGHKPIVIALDEHGKHVREAPALEAIARWRDDGTVLVDKSLVVRA